LETVTKIVKICKDNNVIVLSDEVHGDIVYPGNTFYGTLAIDPSLYSHVIALYSPAKTFNLGGFTDSFMFIKDKDLKDKISKSMKRFGLGKTNGLIRDAVEAAFREGDLWLSDLIDYLQCNIDLVDKMLKDSGIPVHFHRPAASYQLWLDFRESGIDAADVHRYLSQEAKVGMNAGFWFGKEGAGFTRMNIASPRSVIEEGMNRLISNWK
jgi:bifunctional pyridoxal-dependent enzyme with beta-cystathionase and maltose regulon repressor activities